MITVQELFEELHKAGVPTDTMEACVSDSKYSEPNLNYVLGDFATFYKDKLHEMGVTNWVDLFDCDNFAFQFFTMLRWAHYKTGSRNQVKQLEEGIAVGVVYYMAASREENGKPGGHAINVVVSGKPGERAVTFIEPQAALSGGDMVLKLTPTELASIWQVIL